MTERQIQRMLVRTKFDCRRNIVVPNCCRFTYGEADLIVVRKSGWVDEVEIKVSKADYRREFKTKDIKHGVMRGDYQMECGYEYMSCKRFWFAMPLALAQGLLEEMPAYAGLIGVRPYSRSYSQPVSVLKNAPTLPCARKASADEMVAIAQNLASRFWHNWLKEASLEKTESS